MNQSSFLPEDYVERRVQRRTVPIMLALFAVVMLGVGAAFAVTYRQRQAVRASQAAVNVQVERAAKRLDDLDKLQLKKQQMIRKAQVTAVLVERVPRQLILSELVNNKPTPIILSEVNLDTRVLRGRRAANLTSLDQARRAQGAGDKSAPDIEAPQTEVSVQLLGTAPTDVEVAQYMAALARRPLFAGLNLSFSEQVAENDASRRKFRIDMTVNQDLDLRSFDPLMVQRGGEVPVPLDAAPDPGAPAGRAPVIPASNPPRVRTLRDQ